MVLDKIKRGAEASIRKNSARDPIYSAGICTSTNEGTLNATQQAGASEHTPLQLASALELLSVNLFYP